MRCVLLLLVLVCLAPGQSIRSVPKTESSAKTKRLLEQARKLEAEEKDKEAEALYTEAITGAPGDSEACVCCKASSRKVSPISTKLSR
jgi:hypothetical protein